MISLGLNASYERVWNLGVFEGHVYHSVKTDAERYQKEKEFFEKTGFDVQKMSLSDKYLYGQAVRKGYIK